MANNSQTVRPFGMKDRIGYMFGDFGNDFFFILVSSFLMVFYTDAFGLNAAAVGVLFMVARIWDAFADVTWGRFIDSRKAKKTGKIQGKFKPWIFRMSFPLVLSGVLMFIYVPDQSQAFYYAWAYVTYILWGTLYATVSIPYGSMASVMTNDPIERTSLSTFRTLGVMLATLFVNSVAPLIVFVDNQLDAGRMAMAAVLFGVLAIACYMGCVAMTTERYEAEQPEGLEKGAFLRSLKSLATNRPFIAVLVASLLFMMNTMLINSVNMYLYKDYFGNAQAVSIIGIIQPVMTFIAIPLIQPLVVKFGKKEISSIGMIAAAGAWIVAYFIPNMNLTLFFVLLGIGYFGYAFFNACVWAFVTDCIDYHEFKTGMREAGTVYSVYSFGRKIGQALAGGVGGFAIAAVGYNASLEVQTESAVNGIYMLGTLIPGLLWLVVGLIMLFVYPLTKNRVNQLAVDLEAKRNS